VQGDTKLVSLRSQRIFGAEPRACCFYGWRWFYAKASTDGGGEVGDRGVLQGGARRTNRSLAARGSDAPDLHGFRSRVPGVASSAPERPRGARRPDSERRGVEQIVVWVRFSDGEGDGKIKYCSTCPLTRRCCKTISRTLGCVGVQHSPPAA